MNMHASQNTAINLKVGDTALIQSISGAPEERRSLLELGFIPGREIRLLSKGIFRDPLAFKIDRSTIALRKKEAANILI